MRDGLFEKGLLTDSSKLAATLVAIASQIPLRPMFGAMKVR